MEASELRMWEAILTAVTGVATVMIALFAGLTWLVYRKIQQLAEVSNSILERTNRISAQMVVETQRGRESVLRPVILLSPQTSGKGGRVTEVKWKAANQGPGPAFEITATGPGKLKPEREILLAALESGADRDLCEQSPKTGSHGWDTVPYLRVRYRDVFGNWFQTHWIEQANRVAPVEDDAGELS